MSCYLKLEPSLWDQALLRQDANHTGNEGRDTDGCGDGEQDILGVVPQFVNEFVGAGPTRLSRIEWVRRRVIAWIGRGWCSFLLEGIAA